MFKFWCQWFSFRIELLSKEFEFLMDLSHLFFHKMELAKLPFRG